MAGAGITAKERLERIETLLSSIDGKLDGKADKTDVVALEFRVRDIELHGTQVAQSNKNAVDELRRVNEQHLETMRITVETLSAGQNHLQQRLSYYAGGLAALALVLSIVSRYWLH